MYCRHFEENTFSVYVYHGPQRKKSSSLFLSTSNIVLTTYETLAADSTGPKSKNGNSVPLQNVQWHRVVLDEGIFFPQTQENPLIVTHSTPYKG